MSILHLRSSVCIGVVTFLLLVLNALPTFAKQGGDTQRRSGEAEMPQHMKQHKQELQIGSRSESVSLSVSVNRQDSLALVALYETDDGDNWKNSDGWLNLPVADWYGVTVRKDQVVSLNLSENELMGEIPVELGQLANLKELYLDRNELTGEIPTELGQLANLEELNLAANQLTGDVPTALEQLTSLEVMNLAANQLTGDVPMEVTQLTNLKYFSIAGNQLTGGIPAKLGQLVNLEYLSIAGNQLVGEIPVKLGQLTHLRYLYLGKNKLKGAIPASFTNLTQLTHFKFEETNLCEPPDEAFQTWLSDVNEVSSTGVTCEGDGGSGLTITSVSPDSITGSDSDQPLTVRGNGFKEGAFVILDDLSDDRGPFENPDKTEFVSNTELTRRATFTENAATWSARVENPNGVQSDTVHFEVVEGAPIEQAPAASSDEYQLLRSYPNPFQGVTHIRYELPAPARVTMDVYNVAGRKVRTLINEQQPPGAHVVEWNGRDDSGRPVAAGVYLYRFRAANESSNLYLKTKKVVRMK